MCSVANLKFTFHNIYGCDHHGDQGPAVSIPCSIDSLILCIYVQLCILFKVAKSIYLEASLQ